MPISCQTNWFAIALTIARASTSPFQLFNRFHYIVFTISFSLYRFQHIVFTISFSLYRFHYIIFTISFSLYRFHYIVFILSFSLYRSHYILSIHISFSFNRFHFSSVGEEGEYFLKTCKLLEKQVQ